MKGVEESVDDGVDEGAGKIAVFLLYRPGSACYVIGTVQFLASEALPPQRDK